jgi:glucokinase
MPSPLLFCIDVGGTRTKYGLLNPATQALIARLVWPTDTRGRAEFIETTRRALDEICRQASVSPAQVTAGGVGIPGFIGNDLVSMVWEALSFMEGPGFLAALRAALPFPLHFENDARIVALGEAHFGAHGSPSRLLSLTLGTGVGFGLVIDGVLQEKTCANHMAGHMPVRPGGRPCYCGISGCLETLVGAAALVEYYLKERPTPPQREPDARDVFAAALQGDAPAQHAVRQVLADLVAGLNGYGYLFAPEVIVLGGGMAQGLAPWLPEIQSGLFAHPFDGYTVQVRLSQLKEDAGLYGAAALAGES